VADLLEELPGVGSLVARGFLRRADDEAVAFASAGRPLLSEERVQFVERFLHSSFGP